MAQHVTLPDAESADAFWRLIAAGDRLALSRGITLVESMQPEHRKAANVLLDACLQTSHTALRIGIGGPPGVGKSTLIEAFGTFLLTTTRGDLKLAVLAIDPSSKVSGGSILGDKTRMHRLSAHPRVFIRPSPAGEVIGGLSGRTREAMTLCEAAGYDIVIVETVGIGQSETEVRNVVDLLVLLVPPGGGDALQGIKRGILEVADILVVHKADGSLAEEAHRTFLQYKQALPILRADMPEILTLSSHERTGLDTLWDAIQTRRRQMENSGTFLAQRTQQDAAWFAMRCSRLYEQKLSAVPKISELYEDLMVRIGKRDLSARSALEAMERVIDELFVE